MINEKKYISLLKKSEVIRFIKKDGKYYLGNDYFILNFNLLLNKHLNEFINKLFEKYIQHGKDFNFVYYKDSKNIQTIESFSLIEKLINLNSIIEEEKKEGIELPINTKLIYEVDSISLCIFKYKNKYLYLQHKYFSDIVHKNSEITYIDNIFIFSHNDTKYYTARMADGIDNHYLKSLQ